MRLRDRNPETARRCSNCGYNLFGLSTPRCPECGTPFDPNASPIDDWASDPRNVEDVRAIRRERLLGAIGTLLLIGGMIFTGLALFNDYSVGRAFRRREFRVLVAALPLAFIGLKYEQGEPLGKPLFYGGLITLALGLAFWYMSL